MVALRMLKKQYPETLWPAYIPIDTRLRDASREGVVPSRFDKNSRAMLAYRALLKHILAKLFEPLSVSEPIDSSSQVHRQQ